MGLGDEIAEFLEDKPASPSSAAEKTEKVDEKVEETPKGEQGSTEGEKQEENASAETEKKAEEVEKKGTEGEQRVEEKGEKKEEKVVEDDDRIALLNEIARLSGLVQSGGEKKEETTVVEGKKTEEQTKEPQVIPFVKTQEDLQKIFESPESFNKFLTNFGEQVREVALRGIPMLVGNVVRHNVTIESVVRDFYQRNPEFATIKPFVALTVNEVERDNPGKPLGEIMPIVETRIREKLRIVKKEKVEGKKDEPPAFVKGKQGGGGTRGGGKPNSNSQEAQIGELIER